MMATRQREMRHSSAVLAARPSSGLGLSMMLPEQWLGSVCSPP